MALRGRDTRFCTLGFSGVVVIPRPAKKSPCKTTLAGGGRTHLYYFGKFSRKSRQLASPPVSLVIEWQLFWLTQSGHYSQNNQDQSQRHNLAQLASVKSTECSYRSTVRAFGRTPRRHLRTQEVADFGVPHRTHIANCGFQHRASSPAHAGQRRLDTEAASPRSVGLDPVPDSGRISLSAQRIAAQDYPTLVTNYGGFPGAEGRCAYLAASDGTTLLR